MPRAARYFRYSGTAVSGSGQHELRIGFRFGVGTGSWFVHSPSTTGATPVVTR